MVDRDKIKYLPIREFVDLGFLQEVNRHILHPAGLAMALHLPSAELMDQTVIKIWDFRDDPEGMLFAPGEISQDKIDGVGAEIMRHYDKRVEVLQSGYHIGDANVQKIDSQLAPEEA